MEVSSLCVLPDIYLYESYLTLYCLLNRVKIGDTGSDYNKVLFCNFTILLFEGCLKIPISRVLLGPLDGHCQRAPVRQ